MSSDNPAGASDSYMACPPYVNDGIFVRDSHGAVVLACDCGRMYSEREIDADLDFICPCGRLGQRMDEATPQQVVHGVRLGKSM